MSVVRYIDRDPTTGRIISNREYETGGARRTVIGAGGQVNKTQRTVLSDGSILIEGKSRANQELELRRLEQAKIDKLNAEALANRTAEEKAKALEDAVRERTLRARQFKLMQEEQRSANIDKDFKDEGYSKQTVVSRPAFNVVSKEVRYVPSEEKFVPTPGGMIVPSSKSEAFSSKSIIADRENKPLSALYYQSEAFSSGLREGIGGVVKFAFTGDEASAEKVARAGKQTFARATILDSSRTGASLFSLGVQELGAGFVSPIVGEVSSDLLRVGNRASSKVVKTTKNIFTDIKRGISEDVIVQRELFPEGFSLGKKGSARMTSQRKVMRGEKFVISQSGRQSSGLSGRSRGSSLKIRTAKVGSEFASVGREKQFLQNVPRSRFPSQSKSSFVPSSKSIIASRGRLLDNPSFGISDKPSNSELVQSVKNYLRKQKSGSQASLELAVKKAQREFRKSGVQVSRKELLRLIRGEVESRTVVVSPNIVVSPRTSGKSFVPKVEKSVIRSEAVSFGDVPVVTAQKPVVRRFESLRPSTVSELGEKTVKGSQFSGGRSVFVQESKSPIFKGGRVVSEPVIDFSKSLKPDVVSRSEVVKDVSPRFESGFKFSQEQSLSQNIDFKSALKDSQAFSLVPAVSYASADKIDYASDLASDSLSDSRLRFDNSSKSKIKPVESIIPKQRSITNNKSFESSKSVIRSKERFKVSRPKKTSEEVPKRIIPPKFPLKPSPRKPSNKKSEGFSVFIKRKGKFYQETGVYSKDSALRLGGLRVGTSASATFKLVKTSGTPQEFKGGSFNKNSFYRGKKGEFIEKKEKRIKSLGELQEITFKGIASQKNKRRKII